MPGVETTPDGTENESGNRYWDATQACCAFNALGEVDDVGYLRGLIEEAAEAVGEDGVDVRRAGLHQLRHVREGLADGPARTALDQTIAGLESALGISS